MRDITNIDISATSTAMLIMSSRTVEVATRALDLLLSDSGMSDLQMGFHNNLYIMICHAISEIMRVSERKIVICRLLGSNPDIGNEARELEHE